MVRFFPEPSVSYGVFNAAVTMDIIPVTRCRHLSAAATSTSSAAPAAMPAAKPTAPAATTHMGNKHREDKPGKAMRHGPQHVERSRLIFPYSIL